MALADTTVVRLTSHFLGCRPNVFRSNCFRPKDAKLHLVVDGIKFVLFFISNGGANKLEGLS
jgi:hypothetical protein